jgi:hypothetical protein
MKCELAVIALGMAVLGPAATGASAQEAREIQELRREIGELKGVLSDVMQRVQALDQRLSRIEAPSQKRYRTRQFPFWSHPRRNPQGYLMFPPGTERAMIPEGAITPEWRLERRSREPYEAPRLSPVPPMHPPKD